MPLRKKKTYRVRDGPASRFSLCREDNMNKYLMLSAAAVLASTVANAGTAQHTFTFQTAGGFSYCDGGTVYTSGASVWSWQHTNADCEGTTTEGQGLVGKLDAVKGKVAAVSDTYLGQIYGIFSEYESFTFPKKIKNGAPYELWIGMNGTTSFQAASGVLGNVDGGQPVRKGRKSTSDGLKELIQLHKNAQRGK
jgi:hypothetical protein